MVLPRGKSFSILTPCNTSLLRLIGMANPALPRPDMPGPQPVEGTELHPPRRDAHPPLLRASGGEVPDRIFQFAMTVCGFAVLGVLRSYRLRTHLAIQPLLACLFGFKFFAASDWDPVSEKFGALPLFTELWFPSSRPRDHSDYGRSRRVHDRDVPQSLAWAAFLFVELLAAIPSVIYGLWAIFILVPLFVERIHPAFSCQNAWAGLGSFRDHLTASVCLPRESSWQL